MRPNSNKFPILISIFIQTKKRKFYPCLKLSVFGAGHPQILECKVAYNSKEDALNEASQMIFEILKKNQGISNMINVEIIDDIHTAQQYAEDGSFLN